MEQFHLKSMTAFGKGVSDFTYGRFSIEIQGVNRRFLELNISMPRLFNRFEMDIRRQIMARVGRGMINVSVAWKAEAKQPLTVLANFPLAKGLKKAWENLASELGLDRAFPISLLVQEKDLFLYEEEIIEEEAYKQALAIALKEALDELSEMKQKEGEILASDINGRLSQLEENIVFIETHAKDAPEKYRQKLNHRLEELFSGSSENEERILREVAVYAERVDITEEIIRFKSHLAQFATMLEKPLGEEAETRGKTLDFLLQELLRECNTIGSKTSDLSISKHVVVIKSELEKIREQVQNIE
jgi:uncharacterized protein (TIGR00255 family)